MEITTQRIDDMHDPIGPEDPGNEPGTPGGGGGSTTYPTDCPGTIVTTTVVNEIRCGCGHTWQQLMMGICTGCTSGYPIYPSMETIDVYECVTGTPSDPGTGGGADTGVGGGTGSTWPDIGDGNSVTIPINPDGTSAVPDILANFLGLTPEQKDMLADQPDLANELFQFLQQDGSIEAKEFAIAAIEAWTEGGEVDFVNRVILSNDFTENECLYNIYKDLGKASAFNQKIQQFDSKFSVADLKFSANPNFGTKYDVKYKNAMALTNPPATSNMIEIDFNIDPSTSGYIINKPDTFKVVAFIHEVLHAEMYRKMLDALIASAPEAQALHWTTPEQFNAYLNSLENKYSGIFDYYTRFEYKTESPNNTQHQQMAQHYRDVIIQTLTEYDSSLSEKDKVALSWIGLNAADIIAWKNLDPVVKQSINNSITNLKNTASNACH